MTVRAKCAECRWQEIHVTRDDAAVALSLHAFFKHPLVPVQREPVDAGVAVTP